MIHTFVRACKRQPHWFSVVYNVSQQHVETKTNERRLRHPDLSASKLMGAISLIRILLIFNLNRAGTSSMIYYSINVHVKKHNIT